MCGAPEEDEADMACAVVQRVPLPYDVNLSILIKFVF